MTRLRPSPIHLVAAALALATVATLLVAAPRAEAAKAKCGSPFRVLHNDRIGDLKLPAGPYDITLINPDRITCAKASKLFAKFLQDYDGNLPGRWTLNARKARFKKGNFGFQVAPASGGGGGGQHPPQPGFDKCPTFQVLHNDRIGRVSFPKGTYAMTAFGGLSCSKSSDLFARFLQQFQGNLPGRWRLDGKTGTFTRGTSGKGFQVNFRR
jgi:hypothetical protein